MMLKTQCTLLCFIIHATVSANVVREESLFISLADVSTDPRGRIEKFDSSGVSQLKIPFDIPGRIAVDEIGNVYVTSAFGIDIQKFNPSGNSLGVVASLTEASSFPLGLAFDEDGLLYVGANGRIDTIKRFTSDGQALGVFATISTPAPGAPLAIEFDTDGNLYTLDLNTIERFDVDGTSLGTFGTIAGSSFLIDLAFDSFGNLYGATFGGNVQAFDSTGNLLGTIISDPDIRAIAIDENDLLYLAGGGAGIQGFVKRFQTDGTFVDTFLDNLSGEPLDISFSIATPEPTTLASVCLALAGTVILRRRKDG